LVENKSKKKKTIRKIFRIRYKWCKTASFLSFICLFFAIITSYEPKFMPIFVFSLIDLLLVVASAYYVEVLEIEEIKS